MTGGHQNSIINKIGTHGELYDQPSAICFRELKKTSCSSQKIICENGLDNTSIEEITETAKVSKGTFYTYFKRREDIVFELSRCMFGKLPESAKHMTDLFFKSPKVIW